MLKNGFFNNKRKSNAIQTFFIPWQTMDDQVWDHKIWTNKIKPKLGDKIKMADLNKKCGLTLSDNWEQVSVDQMINDSISDKSCGEYNEEEDVSEDSYESDLGNEIEKNYYDGGNDINNNINNMANPTELSSTPTSTLYNSKNSKLYVYEKVIYFMIAFIILEALIISLIKLNITFIIVMLVLLFFEAIFIYIRLKYVKRISKNPVNIIALNEHDEFQKENDFNKEQCAPTYEKIYDNNDPDEQLTGNF